jgi:hypothetical protein
MSLKAFWINCDCNEGERRERERGIRCNSTIYRNNYGSVEFRLLFTTQFNVAMSNKISENSFSLQKSHRICIVMMPTNNKNNNNNKITTTTIHERVSIMRENVYRRQILAIRSTSRQTAARYDRATFAARDSKSLHFNVFRKCDDMYTLKSAIACNNGSTLSSLSSLSLDTSLLQYIFQKRHIVKFNKIPKKKKDHNK